MAAKKGGHHGDTNRLKAKKAPLATYIRRVNKRAGKGKTLSTASLKVINSFVMDQFDRIATEAAALARASKRKTLSSRDIQTAIRILMPPDLGRVIISESVKSLAKLSA